MAYSPKFEGGALAYGVVGAEIRKVSITKVLVSPGATDPIHATNTDSEGRNWSDANLFRSPVAAAKNVLDKFYLKYPAEKPEGYVVGELPDNTVALELGTAAGMQQSGDSETEKAEAEKAAAEKAEAEKAAANNTNTANKEIDPEK